MLIANPSSLALTIRQQNEGFSSSEVSQKHQEYLSQIESQTINDIKNTDYGVQENFVKSQSEMSNLFKKLEIMEVEGKYFLLHKSPVAVDKRARTDKAYGFHLGHFDKIPEF